MKKLFVLSLGGSLINPGEIDTGFLKQFKKMIAAEIKKGSRFIVVCGGGKMCRNYQEGLKSVTKPSNNDLDWMGIYVTWTNAQLVRLMFGKLAHPNIVTDPNKKVNFKEKILIGGGWMPGRSTDDDMVRLANIYQANCVINLFDQDYVYDKDPRKFKDARPIEQISWQKFRKEIVGLVWKPGSHVPFDPIAAGFAQKNNIEVIIANGKNLKNLQHILAGKKHTGTTIK